MKTTATISSLPNTPAVYALMGGHGRNRYVAYVGIAGKLRQRIIQHLVNRDSSVATGTSAACLNPDYVFGIRWWDHRSFRKKTNREAAELVALEVLDPTLRSRGKRSTEAWELHEDPAFNQEMKTLFEAEPSGTLELPTLQSVVERLESLEQRMDRLSSALQIPRK